MGDRFAVCKRPFGVFPFKLTGATPAYLNTKSISFKTHENIGISQSGGAHLCHFDPHRWMCRLSGWATRSHRGCGS
jgi:hypothetical protein